uniref:Uncharacterized protein n=1 Tax=Otarine gammaherpesvirus 4 TaxID=2801541 RepID=A0A889IY55_9GAMA|nr:hypothetical protein [Otarine gammaherpesvirus 4]
METQMDYWWRSNAVDVSVTLKFPVCRHVRTLLPVHSYTSYSHNHCTLPSVARSISRYPMLRSALPLTQFVKQPSPPIHNSKKPALTTSIASEPPL